MAGICATDFTLFVFFVCRRLGCRTTTNCTLGGSALGARNQKSAEAGQKAAAELVDVVHAMGCVDTYVQDQLIVFMALAKGLSRIRCTMPLTLHTKTAIHIAELMTKVRPNRLRSSKSAMTQDSVFVSRLLITGQIRGRRGGRDGHHRMQRHRL